MKANEMIKVYDIKKCEKWTEVNNFKLRPFYKSNLIQKYNVGILLLLYQFQNNRMGIFL